MAKKKTAGTDIPASTTPAPTRRRTTKRAATTPPVESPAIETGTPTQVVEAQVIEEQMIDTAADMSSRTAPPNGHGPTDEEIAEAAYQRYLRRGSEHGRDWDDWLEAERELRSRR
jgi:hypothetical protein